MKKTKIVVFPLPPHFGAVCTIEGRFETLKMDTYLLKIG